MSGRVQVNDSDMSIRPPEVKVKIILIISIATDAPCSGLQGLLSGLLPDNQISASSSRDMMWNPSTARLVASRSGWFPSPSQPLAGEEWLQVGFELCLPMMLIWVMSIIAYIY